MDLTIESECVFCKSLGIFKCERCDDTYCSVECQKIDWKSHKLHCSLMPPLIPLFDTKQKKRNSSSPQMTDLKYSSPIRFNISKPAGLNDFNDKSTKFSVNNRIALARSSCETEPIHTANEQFQMPIQLEVNEKAHQKELLQENHNEIEEKDDKKSLSDNTVVIAVSNDGPVKVMPNNSIIRSKELFQTTTAYIHRKLRDTHIQLPSSIQSMEYFKRSDVPIIDMPKNQLFQMSILDFSTFFTDLTVTAARVDKQNLGKFHELNWKMIEHCQKNDNKPYSPRLGEMCCAIYDEDNEWYRGECIQILDDDNYSIKFIDYGNCCNVNVKNIRKILEEHLYPSIAYNCIIDTDFLSMASSKDILKIYEFLQNETIKVTNKRKLQDQFIITVDGLEEIFKN